MTPDLEQIVEAIIFASPEGASTKEIARCVRSAVASAREAEKENAPESITRFADVDEAKVVSAINLLNAQYQDMGRAFVLQERPAGWRIVSRAEFAPWVRELFPDRKPARLTPSALETLAIIAYRQPMTRSSIEAVRGVGVDGPLQTLLDRNVVRIAGRADLPGRPLLYETTDLFLEHFGIKTVNELPNAAELRSVKLPEPEPPAAPEPAGEPQTELPLAEGGEEAKPKKKTRAKKKAEEPAPGVNTPPGTAAEPEKSAMESTASEPAAEWSPPEEEEEELPPEDGEYTEEGAEAPFPEEPEVLKAPKRGDYSEEGAEVRSPAEEGASSGVGHSGGYAETRVNPPERRDYTEEGAEVPFSPEEAPRGDEYTEEGAETPSSRD